MGPFNGATASTVDGSMKHEDRQWRRGLKFLCAILVTALALIASSFVLGFAVGCAGGWDCSAATATDEHVSLPRYGR